MTNRMVRGMLAVVGATLCASGHAVASAETGASGDLGGLSFNLDGDLSNQTGSDVVSGGRRGTHSDADDGRLPGFGGAQNVDASDASAPVAVPAPTGAALGGLGLVATAARRRRR